MAKEKDVGRTKSDGLQRANQENAPHPYKKQVATESFKWGSDDTCTYYRDHSDCVENGWEMTGLEQLIMWPDGRGDESEIREVGCRDRGTVDKVRDAWGNCKTSSKGARVKLLPLAEPGNLEMEQVYVLTLEAGRQARNSTLDIFSLSQNSSDSQTYFSNPVDTSPHIFIGISKLITSSLQMVFELVEKLF